MLERMQSSVVPFRPDSFANGFAAAAATKTLFAPIDRLIIIGQVHPSTSAMGTVPLVKHLWQQGWTRLFAGAGINVVRYLPTAGAGCLVYHTLGRDYDSRTPHSLLSGAVAVGAAVTLGHPLEVARTRLAGDIGHNPQFRGARDCLSKILKVNGVRGWYSGYRCSLVGGGLIYSTYQLLEECFPSAPAIQKFLPAGCVAFPFDTVRRRMMMQAFLHPDRSHRLYMNDVDCARWMMRNEGGLLSFYRPIGSALFPLLATGCLAWMASFHWRQDRTRE